MSVLYLCRVIPADLYKINYFTQLWAQRNLPANVIGSIFQSI